MKVILQQDIKGQGKKGDLAEVSDGYARNYLLPRRLAVPATADNINAMKLKEQAKSAQLEREKRQAKEYADRLRDCEVVIRAKSGGKGKLFGAGTAMDISQALQEQHGIELEKNRIVLSEHIKLCGIYEVKCRLGHEVTGVIKLRVEEA